MDKRVKCRAGILEVAGSRWSNDEERYESIKAEMSPLPSGSPVKKKQEVGPDGYRDMFWMQGIHPEFEEIEYYEGAKLPVYRVDLDFPIPGQRQFRRIE